MLEYSSSLVKLEIGKAIFCATQINFVSLKCVTFPAERADLCKLNVQIKGKAA